MSLLTKADLEALPPLYAQDGKKGEAIVYVHIFGGSFDFWLTEYDPENREAFGLSDLGMGYRELGYISLDELEQVRTKPFGLPLERDAYFSPTPIKEFT